MMIATHSSACFALTHLLVLLCAFFFLSQEIQEYFICLNHLGG